MENESIIKDAAKLIHLKKASSAMLEEMKILKEKVKPYVKGNPMKLPQGTLFYVDQSSSTYLKKDRMRKVLIETFKLSPQTADRIVEMGAATKLINSYVKISTE